MWLSYYVIKVTNRPVGVEVIISMKDIIIRKAKLDDLPILLNFEQEIIEYERPFEEKMITEKFNYYDLKKLIQSEDSEVLVAKTNDQLIASGYAKIKNSLHFLEDKQHAFLGFMFVAPEFRGKGVNQLVIDELIIWSKNKGMKEVALTVYDKNESAIRAYEKLGFQKNIIEMRMGL